MDYKVQFKSYDAVANTTKVAINKIFLIEYLRKSCQQTAWQKMMRHWLKQY